jgi:hypothetical protein
VSNLERLITNETAILCIDLLATDPKQIPNETLDGQEALSMPNRFESPHLPFSKPNCLMRNFTMIVGPAVGIVTD